jgi:hypothetical protein
VTGTPALGLPQAPEAWRPLVYDRGGVPVETYLSRQQRYRLSTDARVRSSAARFGGPCCCLMDCLGQCLLGVPAVLYHLHLSLASISDKSSVMRAVHRYGLYYCCCCCCFFCKGAPRDWDQALSLAAQVPWRVAGRGGASAASFFVAQQQLRCLGSVGQHVARGAPVVPGALPLAPWRGPGAGARSASVE